MEIKRGWDETRDLLARTSQLCGLSDRQSFPLMVFCSGCIFLTIAASFVTVSSFERSVRLLLNFCKRSLLIMGFLVRYLLTASSVIPWGPSTTTHSCPSSRRCRGYTRFLACWTSLFAWGTFFTCTCWALLWFCYKNPDILKKWFQHGKHETDREQMEQHPKC